MLIIITSDDDDDDDDYVGNDDHDYVGNDDDDVGQSQVWRVGTTHKCRCHPVRSEGRKS